MATESRGWFIQLSVRLDVACSKRSDGGERRKLGRASEKARGDWGEGATLSVHFSRVFFARCSLRRCPILRAFPHYLDAWNRLAWTFPCDPYNRWTLTSTFRASRWYGKTGLNIDAFYYVPNTIITGNRAELTGMTDRSDADRLIFYWRTSYETTSQLRWKRSQYCTRWTIWLFPWHVSTTHVIVIMIN